MHCSGEWNETWEGPEWSCSVVGGTVVNLGHPNLHPQWNFLLALGDQVPVVSGETALGGSPCFVSSLTTVEKGYLRQHESGGNRSCFKNWRGTQPSLPRVAQTGCHMKSWSRIVSAASLPLMAPQQGPPALCPPFAHCPRCRSEGHWSLGLRWGHGCLSRSLHCGTCLVG